MSGCRHCNNPEALPLQKKCDQLLRGTLSAMESAHSWAGSRDVASLMAFCVSDPHVIEFVRGCWLWTGGHLLVVVVVMAVTVAVAWVLDRRLGGCWLASCGLAGRHAIKLGLRRHLAGVGCHRLWPGAAAGGGNRSARQ
jgi:hypothetical protein